eukprot:TRINITY_DN8427_c0_g2_i1.p1 TRINITY_DN8427_c0_g2~~TRINITY_DN8427_c0_g2_i1.p1  ORF type:complete len:370 (-),score=79.98 TRINITY_DN8427_c0_g2_i1:92-1201(-)
MSTATLWATLLVLASHSASAIKISGNTSISRDDSRAPRVYFLFLAVDKISNLDVWSDFFDSADSDNYRAFAHCKEKACVQQLAGSPIVPVPTIGSYYCTDLVSPMNQLLSYALSTDLGPTSARDKFAFISDSSLPAKPFHTIYDTLKSREASDFCVFPPGEWADLPNSDGDGMEVAVKVHQWITLTRGHAEKASEMWQKGVMHNFMSYFQMNQNGWNNILDNNFADNRNWGCLDEFWYMTALFGTLKKVKSDGQQSIELPGFSGSPLNIDKTAGWQGSCDTFVIWAKYMHSLGMNAHERLMLSLDQPSIPHGGNWARPGWWDTISTKGIKALLGSDFLFVRKFVDQPALHDGNSFAAAYKQIVIDAGRA